MVHFLKTMEITWFLPIRAADDRPNIMDSENVDIITSDGIWQPVAVHKGHIKLGSAWLTPNFNNF